MTIVPENPDTGGDTQEASHASLPEAWMLGIRINAISVDEVIQHLIDTAGSNRRMVAAYANIHTINLAQHNPRLKDFLNHTGITFCDGYGLLLGARLAGYHLPGRFTPPDWFPRLAEQFAAHGLSMYFLGSTPGIAKTAALRLNEGLKTPLHVDCHHGMFDPNPQSTSNQAVLMSIQASRPHLLVVGMGQPRQEQWLQENWPSLDVPAAITVGAMFDYLAGSTPRAPRWMTEHGLEWLGRLLIEPQRLWKRYLLGIPSFYLRLLISLLFERRP